MEKFLSLATLLLNMAAKCFHDSINITSLLTDMLCVQLQVGA